MFIPQLKLTPFAHWFLQEREANYIKWLKSLTLISGLSLFSFQACADAFPTPGGSQIYDNSGTQDINGNTQARLVLLNTINPTRMEIDNITLNVLNFSRIGSGLNGNGGAIDITNATLIIDTTNAPLSGDAILFQNNIASTGGVIFNSNNSITNIGQKSHFLNNSSSSVGGGIVNDRSELLIGNQVIFESNTAFRGGAISNVAGTVTIEDNAKFFNNQASSSGSGGAIFNTAGSTLNIGDNAQFDANIALLGGGDGGAIFNNSSVINIGKGSIFSNNQSNSLGGALKIENASTVTIDDQTIFEKNTSTDVGGAIALDNSTMSISMNASFEGNSSNTGGAIANINNSTLTLATNAIFSTNNADNGGAIINNDNSNLTIGSGASFLNNTATNMGGAILNLLGSQITLQAQDNTTTLFSGNSSMVGNNAVTFDAGESLMVIENVPSSASASALLDMRDPMYVSNLLAPNLLATTINIAKNDAGVWALGGDNNFNLAERTNFSINTGTLYLYAANEVVNPSATDAMARVGTGVLNLGGRDTATPSTFTLASGATLAAGGNNNINLSNGNLIIGDNATIRGGSQSRSLGGSTPRNELGGTTSLTLTSDNNTQLQGLVNLQALEARDAFTLNANLVDAPNAVGRVVSSGLGQVTLTGNNTYTGTTTISSGTLALGATGSISPSQGVQVKAGSTLNSSLNADTSIQNLTGDSGAVVDVGGSRLQVNMNSDGRYAGGVNGAGVLAKAGNATLTLTDEAMGFVGEMAIDAGQLTLDIAQDVGYNGMFSGTGILAKEGLATLNLMGENSTFTGDILVNQGVLNMNGRFTQATAIVAPGTVLRGIGTLNSTTVNGTIAPGNSIGTLTINGNYVQNPGSTYEVEINPQGQSDLINVTGAATINGGTVSVLKEAGTYTPQRYTILTAAGGRTDTYDALVQMMPFLDIGLTYDANNVYLDVARSATIFPDVAQTPNQMSTAAGIESLGMGNPVYDAVLNAADTAQALLAFDTNSGELYSSLLSTFVEESRYARQAVLQHLSDSSMTERMKRLGGRYLWAQGYGSWGDVNGTSNTAEVDRQTQGLFIGADMQAAQHTLGVMAGYSNSKLKAPARLSTAKSDNYTLGLYGRHDGEKFIAKIGAAYTWQQFDVHRQAQLPTFTDTLKGSHTAHTAQVFGQLNLVDTFTALHLQPFIGATYVTTDSGRWQEAGIAGLTGHNHFDTFYTHLGLEQAMPLYQANDNLISERVMLAWRHAYTGVYPLSTFAFTSGGNPFAIQGAPIAKDALVMDIGLDATLPHKGLNMRLAYIGQVGGQVQDHGVTGRVSWQFD